MGAALAVVYVETYALGYIDFVLEGFARNPSSSPLVEELDKHQFSCLVRPDHHPTCFS